MATAGITYRWADGEELECVVDIEANYPDAVAEARAQALALFKEGWAAAIPAGDE